jgi:hypothetical protein
VVVVRVWDLAGQFPLGVHSVSVQVLQRAEQLAQARGAVQVQGQVRLALRDLDLAQVEESDSVWVQGRERAEAQAEVEVEVEVQAQGWAEGQARESALPQGYRLDSEEGLVRDLVQVTELELG